MEISPSTSTPDRFHPALVTIKERVRLTKQESTKETFHVVLDTKEAPLNFKVGDSIAIFPQNDPRLVELLIKAMKASGEEEIVESRSKTPFSLREFLTHKANLSRLTSSFLKLFYAYEKSPDQRNKLEHLLQQDNKPLLTNYLASHDPLDLCREYEQTQIPLQEICNQFGPLLPRFYSIASSPLVYKEEIHLTVALFTFTHQEEVRYGVGSHFLCSLATVQKTAVPVYIQSTPHFNLPLNETAPIILIGPGTGIAPYRAFIQERIAKGSTGKNWLFFGERNRTTDYLYEEELERWSSEKKIRLSLAFSRDQQEKLYVQHLMLQESTQLWNWLQEGAYFYVCGDAHKMAKDVDHALHEIVKKEGRLNEEDSKAYVKALRSTKRYLTDVY